MQKNRDFVDEARLQASGGDGGNGAASFRREKYRPKGGPDGGNGGDGGSVVLRVTPGVATLAELARKPHARADRGKHGGGSDKHGAAAEDRIVAIPAGTLVRDGAGTVLADLVDDGASFVAARGGRGGRGNASLATARRKAPAFAERGESGEEATLFLELRVLADVGLVGLPNAGKSSLVARLSAARPKIADYPFTTLTPYLGVSEAGGVRFVVADVPGLIEGAAEGKGLGLAFLRHLERCRVLCYVLDLAAEEDPAETLNVLANELRSYDPALADRATIVAGNKIDLAGATERLEAARTAAGVRTLLPVSALTGDGVEELARVLAGAVEAQREAGGRDEAPAVLRIRPEHEGVEVIRENGAYRVRNPRAERLVSRFDLTNADAVRYVQERLAGLGVEDALSRAGAKAGDEVRIGEEAFEFIPEHGA
jgi:GTP-binding protein